MSIIQISRIQVRTGGIADLPQLADGEFGWADDTKRLFIGNNPNTIGPIPDNTEILTQYSRIAAAGANTDIQYNQLGYFGADGNFTWDYVNQVMTANGNVVANIFYSANSFYMDGPDNITESYTIPPVTNAMSIGPINLAAGVTITVNPNSRWTVVQIAEN